MFPAATNAATFQAYVEGVLVPALHEGDVVVFDNLPAYLSAAAVELMDWAGPSILPLPPYSPDYTPIEEMDSKVKGFLRRVAARVKGDLYDAIGDALKEVPPQDIIGWFKEAGLCATYLDCHRLSVDVTVQLVSGRERRGGNLPVALCRL